MKNADIALVCHEVHNSENLEVRLIGRALEKSGFKVDIIPARFRSDGINAITKAVATKPYVLAFHIQYPTNSLLELSLAQHARKIGYSGYIVCAGPMVTLQPDWVLKRIPAMDGVIRFDAEEPLKKLLWSIKQGMSQDCVPALVTRRFSNPVKVRSEPPNWRPLRHERPHIMGVPIAGVSAVRGCTFRCDYCIHSAVASLESSETKTVRKNGVSKCVQQRRPLLDLADEMAALYHDEGVRYFFLPDANPLPKSEKNALQWIDELRRLFLEREIDDLSLSLNTRADTLTPKIIDGLIEIGLTRTLMGVESSTDLGLKSIGRTGSAARAIRSMKNMAQRNVVVWFNLLLLHQDSTVSTIAEELNFLKTVKGALFNALKVHPYANTSLAKKMKMSGRLVGGEYLSEIKFNDPTVMRFSRLLSHFQANILGQYDPGLRLQDMLLSALIAGRYRADFKPKRELERTLWNLADRVNAARVNALLRLLEAGKNNTDSKFLFRSLKNEFSVLIERIDAVEIEIEQLYGTKVDTFFKNVAAASVLTFLFSSANACNNANVATGDRDAGSDTTTVSGADTDSHVDTETGVDEDTNNDAGQDDCTPSKRAEDKSRLGSIHDSYCDGPYSEAVFHINQEGKVDEIELDPTSNDDKAVKAAIECYEEILKDEVFPCLSGEDVNFYTLFIV